MNKYEEAKYYEQIGRDFTKPIKIFRTEDGEISEMPLIVGITTLRTANLITKSRRFEFVFDDVYPMYNIDNKYIGYVDSDGIFQNMRNREDKFKEFVVNNKLPIYFWVMWFIGIVTMYSPDGINKFTLIGFITSMVSSYGMTQTKWK